MAWPKKLDEINERLRCMQAQLAELGATESAPPMVTKKQLESIDGVGPATAQKILELLESK